MRRYFLAALIFSISGCTQQNFLRISDNFVETNTRGRYLQIRGPDGSVLTQSTTGDYAECRIKAHWFRADLRPVYGEFVGQLVDCGEVDLSGEMAFRLEVSIAASSQVFLHKNIATCASYLKTFEAAGWSVGDRCTRR